MRPDPTTLVLAGSREAHAVVTALHARGRRVIASLREAERVFGAFTVPTRLGAFDGPDAFARWIDANSVCKVIDASHPFDATLTALAAGVCTDRSIPYLRLLRPAWSQTVRDIWHHVPSLRRASETVPQGARVFSNTGRGTLQDYADFNGQKLFIRQTHPNAERPPFPFVEFTEGTPPFSQFREQALFEQLGVTHLICRNVGGAASMSKILAARSLSLPVYMVARPPMPTHLKVVDTVADALAWEVSQ